MGKLFERTVQKVGSFVKTRTINKKTGKVSSKTSRRKQKQMKKIAVVIGLIISLTCLAEEKYMPNEAGGFITLSDEECNIVYAKEKEFEYKAIATEKDGTEHIGCWNSYEAKNVENSGVVNIWWEPGLVTMFKQYMFSAKKERWPE